jgi:diguanylate cyclase (GGDEF)-like protein
VELFPFEGNLGASHKGIAYRLTSLPAPQVIPEVRLNQLLGIHGFFDLHRDALGRYWLNSRPLILLHPESGNFRLDDFTLRNLPGSGFLGFFVDEGGCVWLSNDEGLFQLFPEMPGQDTQMRPPAFSRFSYGDQWLAPQSLGIDLPYNLGKFRFDFAPLTFEPNPQFQFRLDPVDTEWSTWTEQAFTEFPRLWEGRYTFRLRTRYPQGEVSPEALLSFRVRPPWFRSYGAFLGYFLGGTALIGLFLRWRTLKLRYQARSLQLQVEERTAALADSLEQLQATQRELVEKNLALEDANRQLKQLSMKDGLTGVANRRRLDQFLEEEGRRAVRTGHPLSMILLDLDFFKKLNDALGHVQGDQTLIGVAAYLKQVDLRGGDLVARYGGEEFAIVLPQCPLEMALQLAEKIRLGIEGLALPHPESPWNVVTASLGVGTLKNAREVAPTELIRLADHALYQSKTTGRNRVSSLTPWEEAAGPDSPPAAE